MKRSAAHILILMLLITALMMSPALTAAYAAEAETGMPAPDFTVKDKDGNAVTFSDTAGKPVIINIWATWCPPCCRELPYYEQMYQQYGDRITFMMIDLMEDHSTVDAFLAEHGYTFPVCYDAEGVSISAYKSQYIPVSVFIRADGTIAAKEIGSIDANRMQSHIDKIL